MTDAPGRPMTAPNRARSGSGGSIHRRSRSGSNSQSQGGYNDTMSANEQRGGRIRGMEHGHSASLGHASGYGHSQSHGLGHAHSHSQPHSHVHGHTLGKESITSLASIPTSTSTAHTLITPNTTSTSLSRSLSDKPHYPSHYPPHYPNGHYQQQQQQYHQHLAHLGQSHPSYYHTGTSHFIMTNNTGTGSGVLHRSSSATAALPPSSTSSSATATSVTSTPSSVTAYGGGATYGASMSNLSTSGRKPIPTPRRKPVPQHLPATAEVSPFPTLLVVGNGGTNAEGRRAPFPFDISVQGDKPREREALADRGVDISTREVTSPGSPPPPPVPSKVEKEMVPLLGVPGDDAHYVTKSTKARWDGEFIGYARFRVTNKLVTGAMAEIATALRDPNAEAPPIAGL